MPPVVPGTTPLHAHLFARSRADLPAPDTQPLFFHIPAYLPGMEGPPDGFTLLGALIRPQSRGRLTPRLRRSGRPRRRSTRPTSPRRPTSTRSLWSLEQVREIGRAGALADWLGEELYPGPGVTSREDLRNYVRDTAITYHHQVGTCRMGVDELAVVDPQLRVRGVEGLRVADASVMPTVTAGNTHAPTTMIGERAADLVLGRA